MQSVFRSTNRALMIAKLDASIRSTHHLSQLPLKRIRHFAVKDDTTHLLICISLYTQYKNVLDTKKIRTKTTTHHHDNHVFLFAFLHKKKFSQSTRFCCCPVQVPNKPHVPLILWRKPPSHPIKEMMIVGKTDKENATTRKKTPRDQRGKIVDTDVTNEGKLYEKGKK